MQDAHEHAGPQDAIAEPPVVISIVGFKNADDIAECLTALEGLEYRNFIVSICENGGKDAFDRLVEGLKGVVSSTLEGIHSRDENVERVWSGKLRKGGQPVLLLESRANLGFAGGVNVTLRQFARDPRWAAVWLLNPDAQPEPGALTALAKRASETGASIVGGRLVFSDTNRIQLYGGGWRPLMARGYNIGMGSPKDQPVVVAEIEKATRYVNGASLYATRAFIEKCGLMTEDYFLYCEELDWCFKAGQENIRYAHDCVVMHKHGTTIGSNVDHKKVSDLSVYLSERNKLLFSKRFYPERYPLIVLITLAFVVRMAIRGGMKQARVGFRGWLAGVRGETGRPEALT